MHAVEPGCMTATMFCGCQLCKDLPHACSRARLHAAGWRLLQRYSARSWAVDANQRLQKGDNNQVLTWTVLSMCSRSRGPTPKPARSAGVVKQKPSRSHVLRVTGSSVEHSRMSGILRHLRRGDESLSYVGQLS